MRRAPTLSDDRAVAFGRLLHSQVSAGVLDESLRMAEQVRRRWGIDTGDADADRIEAARRTVTELLERLDFTDDQLRSQAERMGMSLDPDQCANYCDNVRRLAQIELQRVALTLFAQGKEVPFRLTPTDVRVLRNQDNQPSRIPAGESSAGAQCRR